MVEDHDLAFPILHDLEVPEEAEKVGAYYDLDQGVIQPAAFILRDGRVVIAVYSSGPVGRLEAVETIKEIDYLREQEE